MKYVDEDDGPGPNLSWSLEVDGLPDVTDETKNSLSWVKIFDR